MKLMNDERGVVPIVVIVAIALISAAVGVFAGYQLGDGTFFSFGVGFGVVFVALLFLSPQINSLIDLVMKTRKK